MNASGNHMYSSFIKSCCPSQQLHGPFASVSASHVLLQCPFPPFSLPFTKPCGFIVYF